jgi:hypothetical protein
MFIAFSIARDPRSVGARCVFPLCVRTHVRFLYQLSVMLTSGTWHSAGAPFWR